MRVLSAQGNTLLTTKETTIDVKVLRDFWDKNGERCRTGTMITVTIDDAMEGIETGALGRVKHDNK